MKERITTEEARLLASAPVDRVTKDLAADLVEEREMRAMATHFVTPDGGRIGAVVDEKTALPVGGWVAIPAGRDCIKGSGGKVTVFDSAAAAFAALAAARGSK